MPDKTLPLSEVAGKIESGMTIGIGGWGSRRKPMAMVREILRSDVTDLTVIAFGGPDVGLLARAGKIRKLIYGFVSLDSIPLDPNFTRARERGEIPETSEYDEGMFVAGLKAGANRLSFYPIRAGLGSDVMLMNPDLKTVKSPYDEEEYVAVPGLRPDVSLIHLNRADAAGNGQYLGPDPYFDDLFAMAAETTILSVEQVVETPELTAKAPVQSLLVPRIYVDHVVEAPGGAHFTTCEPDYGRDEAFQKHYAASAKDEEAWPAFEQRFLTGDPEAYKSAVDTFHAEQEAAK